MPSTKRTSEASGQIRCAAGGLSHWTATYGMSDLPTWEVVARDGQLWWRVCGMGICVEDTCGSRAQTEYEALCRSMGIQPPRGGPSLPVRGPSEVDEPGV